MALDTKGPLLLAQCCPTCGFQSLDVSSSGRISCSRLGCRQPVILWEVDGKGSLVSPNDTVEDLFTYHPPTGDQPERYARIRAAAKTFACIVLANCPAGPDRARAIGYVREAVMLANASIATRNAMARFLDREIKDERHERQGGS